MGGSSHGKTRRPIIYCAHLPPSLPRLSSRVLSCSARGAALAVGTLYQRQVAEEQRKTAIVEYERAQREAELAKLANLGAASVISPDGRRMLRIDADGSLSIIDLETGGDIGIAMESEGISAAIFSPDGLWLALGTLSKRVSIYDGTALKQIMSLRGHDSAVRRARLQPGRSPARLGQRRRDCEDLVAGWSRTSGHQSRSGCGDSK
jgi:WD40 repeat protein